MHSIGSSAQVRRLFVISIVARLPLAMLSIGLVVHAQHLTGSFAAAGVVTGVYAIALGIGGPLLGRARRPARTDLCAAGERDRRGRAAARDRDAAEPALRSSPGRTRRRHRAGDATGRRLPAHPTSSPPARSRRRAVGLRLRGVDRRADLDLRPAARALPRRAVVDRGGARGRRRRAARRHRGVRRAAGLAQLAAVAA